MELYKQGDIMNKKECEESITAINELINNCVSLRAFARAIEEDSSDVHRWKTGTSKIRAKAVIKICKIFDIIPQVLRPDIFGNDVKLVFKKDK